MAAALGEFEVLVLLAVLHGGELAYAPVIRAAIAERTGRSVSRGSIYVTLDRLEAKRYLSSRVDGDAASPGRPRRYYQVAARGLLALRAALRSVERMRKGLELALGDR
jgi:PadR family transcriptional regulator, regulatory protein PadR